MQRHIQSQVQEHLLVGISCLEIFWFLAAIRQQQFLKLIFSIHESLTTLSCAVKRRKGNVQVMTHLCFLQQNVLYFLEIYHDL